jgi:proline dehydrogenase
MISTIPDFNNTEIAFAPKSTPELQKAKLMFKIMSNKSIVDIGSSLTGLAMALHLPISPIFKVTVYQHFCGGENFDECKKRISNLDRYQVGSMLNYGVELKETEEDFETTIKQTLDAIQFASKNKSVKSICIKLTGFGRFDLFEKISANEKLSDIEFKELDKVKERLHRLCAEAVKSSVALYIDAEESWIQAALDNLVDEAMEKFNVQKAIVFNTYQLYRKDRLSFLKDSIARAKSKSYNLGAKIVRGAYMEKERDRAQKKGYPSPIHDNKENVDVDFNLAMEFCLENLDFVSVCIASQSESSNLLAVKLINDRKIAMNHPNVLFSQLYGMGDNITFNLSKLGCNACKYLPYGPVKDVIPYLIRRAEENTSFQGSTGRELKLIESEIKRRKSC